PELDRLGFGIFGEFGNLIKHPRRAPDHAANGPIKSAAVTGLDRTADPGIVGPPVGRAFGNLVGSRPQRDRLTLRDRDGELSFHSVREFFGHGKAMVVFQRASCWPRLAVLSLGPRLAGTPARGQESLGSGSWERLRRTRVVDEEPRQPVRARADGPVNPVGVQSVRD